MKTCEGIAHFGYETPYDREHQPDFKEVAVKKKYTLRRLKNLKRNKDTFQLNKTLGEQLWEKKYDIHAFSESQNKPSLEYSVQLDKTKSYTSRTDNRPNSIHRVMIQEKKLKLSTDNKENHFEKYRLAQLLQIKKREEISIRNKWQDTRHYSEDSNRIISTALRTSDLNFQSRRQAESIDRETKRERESILVLQQEAAALQRSVKAEGQLVEQLEKVTSDTFKRILDKQKKKKELEDLVKQHDAKIKNLTSKVQSLMIEEQGYLKVINQFVEDTS